MRADDHAPRLHVLIPCAGNGSRAGRAEPKQFAALAGRAMVLHTLEAFAQVPGLATVLVVVSPESRSQIAWPATVSVAPCGGPTRAASVAGGLAWLREQGARALDWVLVHDAARCLITPALVARLVDACGRDPVGGLLAVPVADTLKREAQGRAQGTLARDGLWQAQTPQMFRLGLLADALAAAGDAVTDEASAIEAAGHAPLLVPGSPQNLKLTWPEDFMLAEAVLAARQGPGHERGAA